MQIVALPFLNIHHACSPALYVGKECGGVLKLSECTRDIVNKKTSILDLCLFARIVVQNSAQVRSLRITLPVMRGIQTPRFALFTVVKHFPANPV